MTRLEWAIKNYLNKNDIHKDNEEKQNEIITSFYAEAGGSSEKWIEKLIFVHKFFKEFRRYSESNWKEEEKS